MDETETKINKNLTINSEKKDTASQVLQNTRNSEKKRVSKLRKNGIPSYLQITADEKLVVRSSQVCKLFAISDRTLSTWAARGAPQYKRGWWDLAELIDWRLKEAGLDASSGGTTNEAKRSEADARLKDIKANIEEVRLARMLERMVPIDMVETELEMCFANARAAMLRIGEKVFTELYTQYPEMIHDVKRIINTEIETALSRLAEAKNYKREFDK